MDSTSTLTIFNTKLSSLHQCEMRLFIINFIFLNWKYSETQALKSLTFYDFPMISICFKLFPGLEVSSSNYNFNAPASDEKQRSYSVLLTENHEKTF